MPKLEEMSDDSGVVEDEQRESKQRLHTHELTVYFYWTSLIGWLGVRIRVYPALIGAEENGTC